MKKFDKILKIVVMIPSSRSWERALLHGIGRYARYHGPWTLYMDLPDYVAKQSTQKRLDWLDDAGIDGIIARVPGSYDAEDLIRTKRPFMLINVQADFKNLPSIAPDCQGLSRIAVEYFHSKGFKNLAFCGFDDNEWCHERSQYFEQIAEEYGYEATSFFEKSGFTEDSGQFSKEWKAQENKMIEWLTNLPKPVGILTTNDDLGRHVIQTCNIAGLAVPEEVAVLGEGNDELVCELCEPPLSSVDFNAENGGYQAAEILHQMIKGEQVSKLRVVVRSTRVVARQSTDVMAIDDPNMAKAMNFISQNFKKNIKVSDVARAARLSTRVLLNRFRKYLDRSPYEEITRVRIESAAAMLTESNLPISNVAYAIGYDEVKYFTRLFSKVQGMTPTAYRRKYGQT
jgi:LacI family transcriptional regulator